MSTKPTNVLLIVPENNTTMHSELLQQIPHGSVCELLKIPRGKGLLTKEKIQDYKDTTLSLCNDLDCSGFDVVAYGCTAAGFILGPEGDAEMARSISQITRKRVVTTASSMTGALKELGVKNISLLTPYGELVNQQLKNFLNDSQIGVRHFDSFYAPDTKALGSITSEQVFQKASELFADDIDALFIACSQLPTLKILGQLSKNLGKPVLSSIQSTAHFIKKLH
jgi:maleate cis-trans isomerase